MNTIITILSLVIAIGILLIICVSIYNHFQDYIIRINEVESMIDSELREKYDLINRAIPIIRTSIPKDKNIFDDVIKLRSRKISSFNLYRILIGSSNELNALKEEYKDITNSEEMVKIITQVDEIDNTVTDLLEYYNNNITIYNSLVKKFPTNIIALIYKYK